MVIFQLISLTVEFRKQCSNGGKKWPEVGWAVPILWLAVKHEGMEQALEHPRTETPAPGPTCGGPCPKGLLRFQPVLASTAAHPDSHVQMEGCLLRFPPGTRSWLAAVGQLPQAGQ